MKKRSYSKKVKIFLSLIIIGVMIRQLALKEWFFAFTCLYTLALFSIPRIFDEKFNVKFPMVLEIGIYLFIFGSCILGEVGEYYIHLSWWDDLLHTTSGMLLMSISLFIFSLYETKNNANNKHNIFKIIFSFCLTITVLVLWECFEFTMDKVFLTDMQKDTVIKEITSVNLNEDKANKPVKITIDKLIINDEDWINKYGGYIDIGLNDTMHDLFDGLFGAGIISLFSYEYLKKKGKVYAKIC